METILLIDSDPAKLVALSMILRCFGYTVLETGTQGEAWSACNEYQGPIHLVILDQENSSAFLAELQILSPHIRALLVSGKAATELADMPCEYAVLQNPFGVDTLASAIDRLLGASMKETVSSFS